MFEVVFEAVNALNVGFDFTEVLDVLKFGVVDAVLEFFHFVCVVFEDDLGDGLAIFGTYTISIRDTSQLS